MTFNFDELEKAPLIIDATYRGGNKGTVADDPLSKLLPVGNQGGFRVVKSTRTAKMPAMTVLYTGSGDADWPDRLDPQTGLLTFFGDNKKPGRALHDTSKGGNRLLAEVYTSLHCGERESITPFFLFEKTGSKRDVIFRGVAVPGGASVSPDDDLVALWRTAKGQRFQNYRALFTILDIDVVTREWIEELKAGESNGEHAPKTWKKWVETGHYTPLTAPVTIMHRSQKDQEPETHADRELLKLLYEHFTDRPTDFEACALEIWRLQAPAAIDAHVTRAVVDGGRDAIGHYLMGPESDPIRLDFALEAKCYKAGNAVGTKEVSRLISRLRHRQFGVLVTTSFLHHQAYKEIREDQHPVVVISGRDIVSLLKGPGQMGSPDLLKKWLEREYPA